MNFFFDALLFESISEAIPAVRFKFFQLFLFFILLVRASFSRFTKREKPKKTVFKKLCTFIWARKGDILTLSVKRNDLCNTKKRNNTK
jgi:hypothetical protein